MGTFFIRAMKKEDLEEVFHVENIASAFPHPRSFFESELAQPAGRSLVALDLDRIVGHIQYWRVADELHVQNIAVHPDWRRRKVATHLFNAMYQASPGWRSAYLEVRVSNDTALNFYGKMGFVKTGLRKGYYADGEDAVTMTKTCIPS